MNPLVLRANAVLANVRFENYTFIAREVHGGVALQATYEDKDVYTKQIALQYTRKWLLSPDMSESEIVFTALKCVLTSMEHRGREGFMYKGARIGSPHLNVEDLVKLCREGREAAGGRDFQQKEKP